MIFIGTSIPLTPSDIWKTEEQLSVVFPPEFREHYLKYNGGHPEKGKFVWGDGKKTRINCFSSIKEEGFVSLEDTYKNLTMLESYLPLGVIPFAVDDGGNYFCVSARRDDYGVVYYCDNDHYNTENNEECLTPLDASFKNFVQNLSS